jgi:hypothetical protein
MMTAEAVMTNDEERERYIARRHAKLEEDARRRGVEPFQTLADWHCPGLFGSDEEVDEFIAYLDAKRAQYR